MTMCSNAEIISPGFTGVLLAPNEPQDSSGPARCIANNTYTYLDQVSKSVFDLVSVLYSRA